MAFVCHPAWLLFNKSDNCQQWRRTERAKCLDRHDLDLTRAWRQLTFLASQPVMIAEEEKES